MSLLWNSLDKLNFARNKSFYKCNSNQNVKFQIIVIAYANNIILFAKV